MPLCDYLPGRRACAGEALARMELYIFLTTLVLRYRFEPGDKDVDLRGIYVGITQPKPYKILAVPRHAD